MIYSVEYADKEIEFKLIRKSVKNINLRVKADMTVVVSANDTVPLGVIMDFVKEKSPWILKHLEKFEKVQPISKSKKEYVSGESFRYLGRQYRLKVFESDTEYVKYFRGFIHIYTKDMDKREKKKALLDNWFRERANLIFDESLNRMHRLVEKYNIEKPEMKIRKMKSRWGTCYVNRKIIILNLELIHAPKYCIDYVVLHELVHFKHKNHNKDFYNLLTTLMPDWKDRKKILDQVIIKKI